MRLGLIRPKTLWPFPYAAFEEIGPRCRAVVVPEINILGQMIDDVRIAAAGRFPAYHVGDSKSDFLTPGRIRDKVLEVWEAVK